MNNDRVLWLDGQLVPERDARASLLEHGLHYGTGVFEGIRCYETADGAAVFRLDEHLARMEQGAEVLGMRLDRAQLKEAVKRVLQANAHQEAYIRPLVFYGAGSLGLDVGPELPSHVVVATMPWSSHLGDAAKRDGIRVKRTAVRRVSARALPPLKLCGTYVNSVIAKRSAAREGFDEALFVDDLGCVCEATGENVFMVKDGQVTAVRHADALPGITRQTVVELTHAQDRPVTFAELLDADEVFLTGTSAEITPVRQLDETVKAVGPVTRQVQQLYDCAVRGQLNGREGWLTRVQSWAA